MDIINGCHISNVDLSELEKFIIENGTIRYLTKKEYLLKRNDRNDSIGFIARGMFRYTRIDNLGNEHIVGYRLEKEFIGEYTANLCNRESLVNIQAVTDSDVYIVRYSDMVKLCNSSMEYQRLGLNAMMLSILMEGVSNLNAG